MQFAMMIASVQAIIMTTMFILFVMHAVKLFALMKLQYPL